MRKPEGPQSGLACDTLIKGVGDPTSGSGGIHDVRHGPGIAAHEDVPNRHGMARLEEHGERDPAKLNVGISIYQSAMGEREPCDECDGEKEKDGETCPKCKGSGEGKGWIREPNTTAQIWFSKNRMDWTDKQSVEHTGAGGGPIITEQRTSGDRIRDRLDNIQKRLGKPANEAE